MYSYIKELKKQIKNDEWEPMYDKHSKFRGMKRKGSDQYAILLDGDGLNFLGKVVGCFYPILFVPKIKLSNRLTRSYEDEHLFVYYGDPNSTNIPGIPRLLQVYLWVSCLRKKKKEAEKTITFAELDNFVYKSRLDNIR